MAVVVEMHNVGHQNLHREVAALVEHVLSGRMGDWRVLTPWRGASGEHIPQRIAALVSRIVS